MGGVQPGEVGWVMGKICGWRADGWSDGPGEPWQSCRSGVVNVSPLMSKDQGTQTSGMEGMRSWNSDRMEVAFRGSHRNLQSEFRENVKFKGSSSPLTSDFNTRTGGGGGILCPHLFFANNLKTAARSAAKFGIPAHNS